jgi:hypothetical protein
MESIVEKPIVKVCPNSIVTLIYACKKALRTANVKPEVIAKFTEEVNTKSEYSDILYTCIKYVDIKIEK